MRLRSVLSGAGAAILLAASSCVSSPPPAPAETSRPESPSPAPSAAPAPVPAGQPSGSLSATLERDIAWASPESLARARSLIAERRVEGSELGRAMLYAIERVYALVYGAVPEDMGIPDPPSLNPLVRAIEDAAAGRFADDPARSGGGDFGVLLSTLVLLSKPSEAIKARALAELGRLESSGYRTLLAPYLRGRSAEASGDAKAARARYDEAVAMDASFYPARVARARCLYALGKHAEAAAELEPVREAHPEDREAARYLARSYYALGRYLSASPIVQELLRANPTEDEFLIMRAHILVAGGAYGQAGPLLDAYATKHPRDPLYLHLRVLHEWKERKAPAQALSLAESALAIYPEDPRFLLSKAKILLETEAPGSVRRRAAVEALEAVLALDARNLEALSLLCSEAADSGAGTRAYSLLQEILRADPGFEDWPLMVKAALGARKPDLALKWSEKWMAAEPASDEAAAAYVRALVDAGNSQAALARINERLAGKSSPKARSIFLYYRSRLQKDGEAALSDLRSSLLEDPANIDALLAMFDVSFAQRDYKKARFYLRQAQSVSPADAGVAKRQVALEGVAGQ